MRQRPDNRRNVKFNGFDSETIKGFARIVATPHKYWRVNSFEDVVKELIIQGTNYGSSYFCYNMTYDMRAILKYLPEENLKELADVNETIYDDYEIFYIPGKICQITYTGFSKKKRISFYDIAQFYQGLSLDKASELYLNKNKIDTPVVKNAVRNGIIWPIETQEKYFQNNHAHIGYYCKKDAELTARLAELMGQKIENIFNIRLRNFTSKAAISEKLTYKKASKNNNYTQYELYPNHNSEKNSESYAYAHLAFRGGMFDCWRRGTFGGVTEVDISSAYPSIQKDLPNWRAGSIQKVDDEDQLLESDYYGWVLVTFDCPYIPYDSEQVEMWQEVERDKTIDVYAPTRKKVYYPEGLRSQVITLKEYNFLQKYGYPCILENGYVWRQTKENYINPFGWISKIYPYKAEFKKKFGKKSIEYSLIKIALNGTYGKTCQEKGNPVMQDFRYASYITAETRVKIMSFILDNKLEDDVILIATDGIYLNGNHDFSKEITGTGLGSWDVTHFSKGLVLGNGSYQFDEKIKLRGYPASERKIDGYTVGYDLVSDIQKHRNTDKYLITDKVIHKRKPNTFKSCLIQTALSKDDINVFEYHDKLLSCVSDKNKKWDSIKTFDDLLRTNHKGIRLKVNEIEEADRKCTQLRKKLISHLDTL